MDSQTRLPCRILSLDGGGAKGFYTLGVLKEVEALVKRPLYEHFDLIFGTSTGAIIAALLALGKSVDEIHEQYKAHVPTVMGAGNTMFPLIRRKYSRREKSKALARLADDVFGNLKFDAVKTGLSIVATHWVAEKPMIFKASIEQAHGSKGTFTPGFGCTISDAVQASCSAYPFFDRKMITKDTGDQVETIDGGYCANNPSLYSLADALMALKIPRTEIRLLSVGVGLYPEPKKGLSERLIQRLESVQLLQKTLNVNTLSMEQLRFVLFKDVPTVRVNGAFTTPDMATDLMEHDLTKLNTLYQRGKESFGSQETEITELLK